MRRGPQVVKGEHSGLAAALRALEEELGAAPAAAARSVLGREYEPAQQVVARGELHGPGRARGGVDVRGDGSAEAWTGRIAKRLVEPGAGESPYAALGRALAPRVGG